jgi:hypothetical protein
VLIAGLSMAPADLPHWFIDEAGHDQASRNNPFI